MPSNLPLRCLATLACASLCAVAQAQPVTTALAPLKDNTLYSNPEGFFSNGAGEYIFVGRNAGRGGAAPRRGLMQFDFSSIPAGSQITSARLTMSVNWFRGGALSVGLFPLLASWGEGISNAGGGEFGGGGGGAAAEANDATWTSRFNGGAAWTTPGGDFSSTSLANTSVSGVGQYQWSSAAMVAQIQAWFDAPQTNNGWLLKGPESSIGNAKRFGSRENTDPALRPSLEITYVIPTPASAVALAGLGVVALRRRR